MKKQGAVIIFQKKPEKGKVKTRLAKTVGEEKAVAVYDYLLSHTHEQVLLLDIAVFVFFEKEIQAEFIFNDNYFSSIQCKGDLGKRMEKAFEEVLGKGFRKAVIIGTDCPGLKAGLLQEALRVLDARDLVIGPANDGGYYLLGMNKPHPALFESIPWSTATVFSDTMEVAARLGLETGILQQLTDVDIYEDLDSSLKAKLGI